MYELGLRDIEPGNLFNCLGNINVRRTWIYMAQYKKKNENLEIEKALRCINGSTGMQGQCIVTRKRRKKKEENTK